MKRRKRDRLLEAITAPDGDAEQLSPRELAREVKRILKAMRAGQQPTDEDLDLLDQARDLLLSCPDDGGDDDQDLDQEELIDELDDQDDETRDTSEAVLHWIKGYGPLPGRSAVRRSFQLLTEGRKPVTDRAGIPIGRKAKLDWLRR